MNISINEIAEKAGVSVATVSRALNKNGPVKEQTRQRILQIAKEHHYKPNSIARGLSKNRTETIGVIREEASTGLVIGGSCGCANIINQSAPM